MSEKIYQSTRSGQLTASPAQAVLEGIAPDGGLYTPRDLPRLDCERLLAADFYPMAAALLHALLPDFTEDELLQLTQHAYAGKFADEALTPLVPVGDCSVLELFHGPTSAFKDVALCLLPHLMQAAARKCGSQDEILILTATSGDTGKAAMAGFQDVKGTRIIVFYPQNGVSPVQQLQMVTQDGKNVKVCAVQGNFDDAQSHVKQAFRALQDDPALKSRYVRLSSANSINIGRLAPQVVYYFTAYRQLMASGCIRFGDPVDFSVPTGNFGDILAGFIAKQLGLPVGRLICASNANDVLTDFLRTGCYDRRRPFHLTCSPSMDILISSNLERLLFLLSKDEALVADLMKQLNENGFYQTPEPLMARIRETFWGACCDDAETLKTIGAVWQAQHYLLDPHSAVAWSAAQQYKATEKRERPIVVLSTASPYKFPQAVLTALGVPCQEHGTAALAQLEALTGLPVPQNLRGLSDRAILHRDVIRPEELQQYVYEKAVTQPWNR